MLCENSFADKIFFTNSGAEAIECGIKIIRNYFSSNKNLQRKNIITFEGAFHGRTLGALSAQKNEKYSRGFEPLLSGFIQAPFNDLDSLTKLIDHETAAILVEPIQGEGGSNRSPKGFIKILRKLGAKIT